MNKIVDIFELDIKIVADKEGKLVAIENSENIPFEIKRVFYIFDLTESSTRGSHANENLDEVLVALHGSCEVILDNGIERKKYTLDKPNLFLYLPSNTWLDIVNFRDNCILLVLCSEKYCDTKVIRNYNEYITNLGKKIKDS